ncbi:MAG: GDP-L-fucose synthase, partial [Verrucomicrobiaceae bacterium]
MDKNSLIYVAGHRGMVGSALWRELQRRGYTNLIGRTRAEMDLCHRPAVDAFYAEHRPEYVFFAAAKVGGIHANDTYPAEFLYDNLQIQTALIDGAYRSGVKKLLFLGSSCIYPKHAPQPIPEDALLTGPLEPTNEWYAIAKIAGIKLCQAYRKQYGCDFISAMPTNLYGPNDNYHPQNSHVLPAMIRRFHEAKVGNAPTVTCWGTGRALREFLHADDLARACVFLMETYSAPEIVNIGCGSDLSIYDLAHLVAKVVGYQGEILWDTSKPDGTPRELMDSARLFGLGWKPDIALPEGIGAAYQDFLERA